MIKEQIINLLTSGAAITTIVSGLNRFFGNKYITVSKLLFRCSVFMFIVLFLKEIICLYNNVLLAICFVMGFFIVAYLLSNRDEKNLYKKLVFTSILLLLVVFTLVIQKYIVAFWYNDYDQMFINYLEKLKSMVKIVEIYKYILSTENIIYTFSNCLNMVITGICFCLTYRLYEYSQNEDYSNEIDKIICYSCMLFPISCGLGIWVMNEVLKKF